MGSTLHWEVSKTFVAVVVEQETMVAHHPYYMVADAAAVVVDDDDAKEKAGYTWGLMEVNVAVVIAVVETTMLLLDC